MQCCRYPLKCYASEGLFFLITQADLHSLLPEAALRRITGLVHLAVKFTAIGVTPLILEVPLARTTPYLTYRDLSENNFGSIPDAIMGLERLECLKICKCRLQLRQQDLAVLLSLSKLRALEMRKEKWSEDTDRSPDSPYHTWDRKSRELMNSLQEKSPELDLQIDLIPSKIDV